MKTLFSSGGLAAFFLFIFAVLPARTQYAASPLTQLELHSETGDQIGQGKNYLYHADEGMFVPQISVNSSGKVNAVTIQYSQNDGERWNLNFNARRLGTELIAGNYDNAQHAVYPDAGHPGLEVSGIYTCSALTGRFTILEAVYDYSSGMARLVRFAATFEQHCNGDSPALTGAVYYHSVNHPNVPDTSKPRTTLLVSGTVGKFGRYNGRVRVALQPTDADGASDIAQSFYTVDGGATQTYTGPFVVRGDAFHQMTFWSVDRVGNEEPTRFRSIYIDSTGPTDDPPLTQLQISSEPGEPIGQGKNYLYKATDGTFSAGAFRFKPYYSTRGPFDTVEASFSSPPTPDNAFGHSWNLTFTTNGLNATLAPGLYRPAARPVYAPEGFAGMEIIDEGRGSNTVTGKFTILDAVYNDAGSPSVQSFAATFEQHSDGLGPALAGTLFYRSQAYVRLTPYPLAAIAVAPTAVYSNDGATGTVRLSSPADRGGQFVTLESSNPQIVTVPPFVFVSPGKSNATFAMTTKSVLTNTPVVITADGDGVVETAKLNVAVRPNAVYALTLSPSSVFGGTTVTAAVTLTTPAPAGGTRVALASTNTNAATVPASLLVSAGATQATFLVATKPVAVGAALTILASANNQRAGATLNVAVAVLKDFNVSPTSVYGGVAAQGTLTLSGPAPSGGLTVLLNSYYPQVASVPKIVLVPAGASEITFRIPTAEVTRTEQVTLKATRAGFSINAVLTLTVRPAAVSRLTVSPVCVYGGIAAVGGIVLTSPAPSGGVTVILTSSRPQIASVPASIFVPAGASSQTFSVTTHPVAAPFTMTLTASGGGLTRTAALTVQPPTLQLLTLSPTTVRGGDAVQATITLTSPAPPGDLLVYVFSSTDAAVPPASILFLAGASSRSFVVRTQRPPSPITATLTATLYGNARTARLSVTP